MDYYVTLGVPPSASSAEVRQAWRTAVVASHPDRNPGNAAAARRCAAANEAWHVLSDAGRRADYDRARRQGGGFSAPAPAPDDWWMRSPGPAPAPVYSTHLAHVRMGHAGPVARRRAPDPGYWDEQAWLEAQYGRWSAWTRTGHCRLVPTAQSGWTGYRRRMRTA